VPYAPPGAALEYGAAESYGADVEYGVPGER
jgi:hypothetical protein